MKKGAKIGIIISLSVIALGVITFRFMPSYSVKDAHNQEMRAMRSAMRRRSVSGNSQTSNDSSYYYIPKNNNEADMSPGAYAAESDGAIEKLKDGIDALKDSMISVGNDALGEMGTQVQVSENRDWQNMIREYRANPEKMQKEFLGNIYTFCDVISQTGITLGSPYIMFEKDGMSAYMFFDSSYKEEIENMDLHAIMRKTITGMYAGITSDTVTLFGCHFGY